MSEKSKPIIPKNVPIPREKVPGKPIRFDTPLPAPKEDNE